LPGNDAPENALKHHHRPGSIQALHCPTFGGFKLPRTCRLSKTDWLAERHIAALNIPIAKAFDKTMSAARFRRYQSKLLRLIAAVVGPSQPPWPTVGAAAFGV